MNLETHIRNVPDFPKPGIQFKDITPLLQNPQAFQYCIDTVAAQWQDKQIDAIGMFDARGFLFGTALAYKLGVSSFPLRKKGKLPYSTIEESYGLEYGKDTLAIHTDALKPGQRVLLIDDLLATGGTMKAGCTLVEKLGATVAGCQTIIELNDLGGREVLKGYDVHSVVKYHG